MLLDIAPMQNGSIPADAKLRYAELGGWIRACYGKAPVAAATMSGGTRTVMLSTGGAVVDRVVLTEDIAGGELVRGFTIELLSPGGTWSLAVTKQSVGHKRIALLPSGGAAATAIRVNVTATLDGLPPALNFTAFTGQGCATVIPCGVAARGQPIKGGTCATPGSEASVEMNQAWQIEVLWPALGIGGTDVVRLRLLDHSGTAETPMCLAVSGPPGPGEFSNATRLAPCNNDTAADPFDPGAEQRFSYDRTGVAPKEGPWALMWMGDGTPSGLPGCLVIGKGGAPFNEQLFVHPYTYSPIKTCGALPFAQFRWTGGAGSNISTLMYPDDGHGSGPLCIGACGAVPPCSFEPDYAYLGPAFAVLPGATTRSCCAACRAAPTCAVFVLNGTSCALKSAMTGGAAAPGVVSGDPNR